MYTKEQRDRALALYDECHLYCNQSRGLYNLQGIRPCKAHTLPLWEMWVFWKIQAGLTL